MTEELTRRALLKNAGFAIASIVSMGGVSTLARAQEPQQEDPKDKEQEPEEPNADDLFEEDDSAEEETRACPQCGALMYKQGDVWSCETCGYSYVE